ncbi:DUF1877 family protein [Streptomyces sediminimaris]|uniref:DUF1877 family protein n=1 Tax=Streptomyces sediminimaris TaxID=3383721 RepID=UPI0039998761
MNMIGEYLRITAAELDQALQDPACSLDFMEEIQCEEETEPAPGEERYFCTYHFWDRLRFLLARAEFPVNVIDGEEAFAEHEEWGDAPPKYLRPERVELAARALRATGYDRLISGAHPAEPTGAEACPHGRGEPGALERGRPWYDGLAQFFEAAARADDAVLVWLH